MTIYAGTCDRCGHLNIQKRPNLTGEYTKGFAADCTAPEDNDDGRCWNEVYMLPHTDDEIEEIKAGYEQARRNAEDPMVAF
ncbi:hypothetical protein NS365_05490 [Aureimonas ureilytica]|uniref:Uncharacterized protein n=1 Tax=Aureimonas ureilytica TaxID=401562 RepID=A0A175RU92_9HYPH|nr:hypothetical protein [Aureimonas ureilytica]KTR06888.1 hypothetical protein NS365_05490 [Aureimonas ureilytica]